MVLEMLQKEHPGKTEFESMKVVILPGKNDKETGGPPTLLEIEKIENRYQYQSDGKSEYSHYNLAISARRKIDDGFSLEEQLRDDPTYAELDNKEFESAVKKFRSNFLEPLECIDRYLELLGRQGIYETVGKGKEGRWQAFVDYYNYIYKRLKNEKELIKLTIPKEDVGKIEDAAFKIIRMRDLSEYEKCGFTKVHKIMRDLPEILEKQFARKELLKISKIQLNLPEEDCKDKNDREISEEDKDKKWAKKHAGEIISSLKKAFNNAGYDEASEKPLDLLKQALKKLNHENMVIEKIHLGDDMNNAMRLAGEIQKRAHEIETECYHAKKGIEEIETKHKNK